MKTKCQNCQKFCKNTKEFEIETVDYKNEDVHQYAFDIGECCQQYFASMRDGLHPWENECVFCENATDKFEGAWLLDTEVKICPACFVDYFSNTVLDKVDYYWYMD